ncbi:MADS box transcription factor [Lithospermum erythrorhizon]|uniref:MADS box transcription factor n=1 Tax=Lithospermum erythrorhizon TaxID=34254 RepID=A0AAV3Q3M5_LITER
MTRRTKVQLQLIPNESERKVSFRKRKTGLIKKLIELSTLCDVDACAIILSPFNSNIDVWPSPPTLQNILTRFRDMPETEQTKHMYNQETFTRERIQKEREQLRKLSIENQRIEIDQIINQCMSGTNFDFQNNLNLLNNVDVVLRQNIQEINIRINTLKGENFPQNTPMGG